jgi:hypothetical protein
MTAARATLPQRRAHEAISFRHWGIDYTAGFGRASETDPVQEVFLNCGKTGGQSDTLARDSAVLLSIALQYGVPIETMKHAITRNVDGSPAGPIGALLDLMVTTG